MRNREAGLIPVPAPPHRHLGYRTAGSQSKSRPEPTGEPLPAPRAEVPVYAWYRASSYTRTAATWGVAGFVLTVGGLLDAFTISTHTRGVWPVQAITGVLGAICTVSGPLIAIGGLLSLLRDDTVLVLRADGVTLFTGRGRGFMSWGELVGVEVERGVITLVGEERRWALEARFDREDTREIAEQIPRIQRKALMGIR